MTPENKLIWDTVKHDIWLLPVMMVACWYSYDQFGLYASAGWFIAILNYSLVLMKDIQSALEKELQRLNDNETP